MKKLLICALFATSGLAMAQPHNGQEYFKGHRMQHQERRFDEMRLRQLEQRALEQRERISRASRTGRFDRQEAIRATRQNNTLLQQIQQAKADRYISDHELNQISAKLERNQMQLRRFSKN